MLNREEITREICIALSTRRVPEIMVTDYDDEGNFSFLPYSNMVNKIKDDILRLHPDLLSTLIHEHYGSKKSETDGLDLDMLAPNFIMGVLSEDEKLIEAYHSSHFPLLFINQYREVITDKSDYDPRLFITREILDKIIVPLVLIEQAKKYLIDNKMEVLDSSALLEQSPQTPPSSPTSLSILLEKGSVELALPLAAEAKTTAAQPQASPAIQPPEAQKSADKITQPLSPVAFRAISKLDAMKVLTGYSPSLFSAVNDNTDISSTQIIATYFKML